MASLLPRPPVAGAGLTTNSPEKETDMTQRPCIPPPPRDTVECAPDLDDLAFCDEMGSGTYAIPPERAATMRAGWAAAETVLDLPSPGAVLDGEADPFATTYPGSMY